MQRPYGTVNFLITGLSYGGAETQLVRLATKLKERGWRVRVVSMLSPQAYSEELKQAGIPVDSLGMLRGVPDPRAVFRLVRILRREHPVVLTTFMYHANVLGRVAGRLSGTQVVVSSIRNENFGGPARDQIMRLTDWMADMTTVNSRLAGEALIRRGVVPSEKLRVIPNGLDTIQFVSTLEIRGQMRESLGLDEYTFAWLAVGRLEEQKDYPSLLAAFARVAREYPKAVLYIAGEGPLRQLLEDTVRRLGLGECVQFLGIRRDIPNLLAAADALVLASAWEGLPNVVMEAMAAAKPVVATRVGGVPELVEEGKTGLLVAPKNSVALASAMLRIMNLPIEVLRTMGRTGRAHVEANYSMERVVDQWEALYSELVWYKRVKL